jgi:hypothetical protein
MTDQPQTSAITPRPLGKAFDAATIAGVLMLDLAELGLAIETEKALDTLTDAWDLSRRLNELREQADYWGLGIGVGDRLSRANGLVRTTSISQSREEGFAPLRDWIAKVKHQPIDGVLKIIRDDHAAALGENVHPHEKRARELKAAADLAGKPFIVRIAPTGRDVDTYYYRCYADVVLDRGGHVIKIRHGAGGRPGTDEEKADAILIPPREELSAA